LLCYVLAVAAKKTIKFHGLEVDNVIIHYSQKTRSKPKKTIEEFDAAKYQQVCETVNVQVVSDFVTITFYKNEKANSIIKRELIPTYNVEHVWVKDMPA
jgi:hypothetical protein